MNALDFRRRDRPVFGFPWLRQLDDETNLRNADRISHDASSFEPSEIVLPDIASVTDWAESSELHCVPVWRTIGLLDREMRSQNRHSGACRQSLRPIVMFFGAPAKGRLAM
jgi:hypothetical protein